MDTSVNDLQAYNGSEQPQNALLANTANKSPNLTRQVELSTINLIIILSHLHKKIEEYMYC